MSKEIDVRRCAHPYVRSKGPSLRPDHLSLVQGGGWRSSMADGHREAAPSVLEGHPPPCDAGDRRALGRASASLDPYRLREAELGSPSKSGTKTPSITVILLIARRFAHGRLLDDPICWFGRFAKADFDLR